MALGDFLMGLWQRGQQRNQDAATLEALASYGGTNGPDGGAPAGAPADQSGGYNPMMPTPSGGGGNEEAGDEGPSPAAQAGQRADAIRKLVQAYAPDAKDLHTGLKAMSLGQLEGMLKGYTMQQAAQENSARIQLQQAQVNNEIAQGKLRDQQAKDDQTVGKLVNAYGSYSTGTGPDGQELPASPGERLRYALSQVPEAAGGRVLPKAIEALSRYEQVANSGGGTSKMPQEFKIGNRTGIYSPATGHFQMDKAPGSDLKPLEVPDRDGNVIAYMMPTGDGRYTKLDPAATIKPADIARMQLGQINAHRRDHTEWAKEMRDQQANLSNMGSPKSDAYKSAQARVDALKAAEPKLDDYLAPIKALTPAAGKGPGAQAAADGPVERVTVQDKDGNTFTVPKNQLAIAKKQGYEPVQ